MLEPEDNPAIFSMYKSFIYSILLFSTSFRAFAAEPVVKPPVTVAVDGFPTGTDTPEGAACDLARAFIHDDAALFQATCIEPFGSPEERSTYRDFLRTIVLQMKTADPASTPTPESPKRIAKCFAARHLTQGGPTSYAYASFGFQDIVFVDVSATLQSGDSQLCRTLVIKDKLGKWAVYPQPDTSPLLSAGLDDETPSTQDFSEAYPVKQTPAPSPTPAPAG